MARYSPDTTVLGAIAVSILGTTRGDELHPYFEKYGLSHYDPQKYYPIEPLMSLVNEIIAERRGMDSMFDLVSLGIANGMSIPLPPEVNTLEKWLNVWESRHPMLYHGSDIGHIKVEKLGPTHYQARVRWPWEDSVAYGTIYGMCKRFLPPGTPFTVYYDESVKRADQGGDETVIHIKWTEKP